MGVNEEFCAILTVSISLYAVELLYKSTVSVTGESWSFDTIIVFILNTLLLDAEFATKFVALVPTAASTADFPVMVLTFTILGADIVSFLYYPPNTIAIAIALPVVTPPPLLNAATCNLSLFAAPDCKTTDEPLVAV